MSNEITGVDVEDISDWFQRTVPDVRLPLEVEFISGGRSNLTFAITEAPAAKASGSARNSGGPDVSGDPEDSTVTEPRRWVLRRPPLGQVLATAHDMSREHRIISALAGSDVPVPTAVGLSNDDSVNGAPFYVMDFVDGLIIRTADQAEKLDLSARHRAGQSLVEVLAAIHAVDVDAVGLGTLAKKEDYIARQLKRWYSQFTKSDAAVPGGLGLDGVHDAHDALAAAIPVQTEAAIVHGDYRLDNCMLGYDGNVAAVLDWEICTLGDPRADVGLLWVYWPDAGEAAVLPGAPPTSVEGFMSRRELIETYENVTGRDLTELPFFVAFGYWKLTCIIAGVYARSASGAMGDVPENEVALFRFMLDSLIASTLNAIDHIGSDWRGLLATPNGS